MKRRVRLLAIAAAALLLTGLTVVSQNAFAAEMPVYTFFHDSTRKCMIPNSPLDSVVVETCSGNNRELWTFNGRTITDLSRTRCLTAVPATSGVKVARCDPRVRDVNQNWLFTSITGNPTTIISESTGLSLFTPRLFVVLSSGTGSGFTWRIRPAGSITVPDDPTG